MKRKPFYRGGARHVYHHSEPAAAKVSVEVERNSKGYNWKAGVTGARSVDEALDMLQEAEEGLKKMYREATGDESTKTK